MCLKESIVTLFQSPTRFFHLEKAGRWNLRTLVMLWGCGWLACTTLGAAGQSTELARYGSAMPFWDTLLAGIQAQGTSAPMALMMAAAIVVFLWVTGWAVKARLRWRQALVLTLFFSLPAAVTINAAKPLGLLVFVSEPQMAQLNITLLLVFVLWAMTTLILGIQAYSQSHWVRATMVALPVMLLLFMAVSPVMTPMLLDVMGLDSRQWVAPPEPETP